MLLPRARHAKIEPAKVRDYLLDLSHPDGRSKAAFFMRFGFRVEEWQLLAVALKELAMSNPVSGEVESRHGTRYTVDGPLQATDGRRPLLRTVWIIEPDMSPRLITAYPL